VNFQESCIIDPLREESDELVVRAQHQNLGPNQYKRSKIYPPKLLLPASSFFYQRRKSLERYLRANVQEENTKFALSPSPMLAIVAVSNIFQSLSLQRVAKANLSFGIIGSFESKPTDSKDGSKPFKV
jgi:hypothetical protein